MWEKCHDFKTLIVSNLRVCMRASLCAQDVCAYFGNLSGVLQINDMVKNAAWPSQGENNL
jgi:hypothetical protein